MILLVVSSQLTQPRLRSRLLQLLSLMMVNHILANSKQQLMASRLTAMMSNIPWPTSARTLTLVSMTWQSLLPRPTTLTTRLRRFLVSWSSHRSQRLGRSQLKAEPRFMTVMPQPTQPPLRLIYQQVGQHQLGTLPTSTLKLPVKTSVVTMLPWVQRELPN